MCILLIRFIGLDLESLKPRQYFWNVLISVLYVSKSWLEKQESRTWLNALKAVTNSFSELGMSLCNKPRFSSTFLQDGPSIALVVLSSSLVF